MTRFTSSDSCGRIWKLQLQWPVQSVRLQTGPTDSGYDGDAEIAYPEHKGGGETSFRNVGLELHTVWLTVREDAIGFPNVSTKIK